MSDARSMADEILLGMPNKKPKRHRITKTGLVDRRAALLEIVRAAKPATVRQIFYLASVRGIVAKDEGGYSRVQIDLVDMRRSGQLPYGWIVDHTRWQRKPVTFNSIDDALADTAATYRKALWRDADSYVEIWLEKDALSGVTLPITNKFDLPLMVARGYQTMSQPASHARTRKGHGRPRTVTQRQIDEWSLPTRPTKQSDSRAKKFGPVSVELDAINPNKLRELVEQVVIRHLPPDQYEILIEAEKSERTLFQGLAGLVKQLAQRKAPDDGAAP